MGFNFKRLAAAVSAFVVTASSAAVPTRLAAVKMLTASAASNASTNVLEYLDRGISAVNTGSGMLVNWRFLTNDADDAVFKLYRDGTLIYTSNAVRLPATSTRAARQAPNTAWTQSSAER